MYIRSSDGIFLSPDNFRFEILTASGGRPANVMIAETVQSILLRVKLDYELFLHRHGEILAQWQTLNDTLHAFFFEIEPLRDTPSNHCIKGVLKRLDLFTFFTYLDGITNLDGKRRDVDPFPIYRKVSVADKLTCLGARVGKPQAKSDIIEATLQQDEQVCTRNSALPFRPDKKQVELLFGKTIHSFDFLLFTQLNSEIRRFSAATLAVLSRRVSPPVKGTLVGIAAITFEK
jgi:hypothetical protein